jgi:Sigma-70 region 2
VRPPRAFDASADQARRERRTHLKAGSIQLRLHGELDELLRPVAEYLCPLRRALDTHTASPVFDVAQRRLGVRPNDIEDVGQEIFVVVHRRLPDLQPDVPIRSWLFGIARRVVANYRRQAGRPIGVRSMRALVSTCFRARAIRCGKFRARATE